MFNIPNLSYIEAKSGLNRNILPEPFLVSLYRSLPPYRGCTHACIYCDGRSEKYFVDGNFDNDIAVRDNILKRVQCDVDSHFTNREFGAIAISSGVTDVYQPIEEKLELTRSLLKILIPTGLPIVILTKNDLVLRDFDLLKQFPQVLIITTITTVDEKISNLLEPGASSPEKRLNIIKKSREAGFLTGTLAMPLCPGITDTYVQTDLLFNKIKDAGSQFISPGGLTLRPGCQKELFIKNVKSTYPELLDLYNNVYGENRQSGIPRSNYSIPGFNHWNNTLDKMEMPRMIPYSIYKELLSLPDSIYVLLCNMSELYSSKGVNTSKLKIATKKYENWLKKERTALRRKRIPFNDFEKFIITEQLTKKLKEADLNDILENEKLALMLNKLINENMIYDYISLSVK